MHGSAAGVPGAFVPLLPLHAAGSTVSAPAQTIVVRLQNPVMVTLPSWFPKALPRSACRVGKDDEIDATIKQGTLAQAHMLRGV